MEHARLDGNGDGEAAAAPLTAAAEGELARRLVLGAPVGTVAAEAGPEARRLLAERAGLQTELEALRESRADYGEDEYLDLLEDLLVRIAELDAQLRALGAEQ